MGHFSVHNNATKAPGSMLTYKKVRDQEALELSVVWIQNILTFLQHFLINPESGLDGVLV